MTRAAGKKKKAGKPAIRRDRELFVGGMARLTLGVREEDGSRLVIRELLPRNLFRIRIHLAFVTGTILRQKVTPHPHIVASIARGHFGLVPYEMIEYVDGSSLKKLLQTRAPVVKERSLDILRQTADALAHLHDRGILHLDVKGENVLVDTSGADLVVKLTDFDLSRECTGTRTRHKSGTEVYMAPEALRHGAIGPATDIFAFGVMAYNLVTGRMPFQGRTKQERRWQQMSNSFTVVEPKALNPDLSPKLDWIIMRCLEKDPACRFPDTRFLCKELGSI